MILGCRLPARAGAELSLMSKQQEENMKVHPLTVIPHRYAIVIYFCAHFHRGFMQVLLKEVGRLSNQVQRLNQRAGGGVDMTDAEW